MTNCFIDALINLPSPHFRTTPTDRRLLVTLALSLLLHGLPWLPGLILAPNKPSTAAIPLSASLRPPAAPIQAAPPLSLPEPAKPPAQVESKPPLEPKPPAKPPTKTEGKPARTWTQAVRQHLKKLDALGQFYPAEAIARGLQGEVLVLLIIDENGQVVAARVEQGSGHPLLDEAALRAVRSLRSLPADTPREMVLPVHFRLR